MAKSNVKPKRWKQNLLILFSLFALIIPLVYVFNTTNQVGYAVIKDRYFSLISYDKELGTIVVDVAAGLKENECAVTTSLDDNDLIFQEVIDGVCRLTLPIKQHYVYFKDVNGLISEPFEINNVFVGGETRDKYYIAIGDSIDFSNSFVTLGDSEISIKTDSEGLQIDDLHVTGIDNTNTMISFVNNGDVVKVVNVVVTNTITMMPQEFDKKKPYLPCNQYSEEEANLLDEILADRVNVAGVGTRAGAVAAARFLTLELPFKLTYFYENGRISGTSPNYADGEGRYYHKGMYLNKSKFSEITYKVAGPATWGCPLTNYEPDEPYFYEGVRYPNGLDCSGFVSWVLLNGGFDPGDIGAGESWYPNQLTDLGDFTLLDDALIASGRIKVGDLFNTWGHISILVGMDDDNFYIAESLNFYGGVVIRKYRKYAVYDYFQYVVFMDDYYKEDGNLTNLWY